MRRSIRPIASCSEPDEGINCGLSFAGSLLPRSSMLIEV